MLTLLKGNDEENLEELKEVFDMYLEAMQMRRKYLFEICDKDFRATKCPAKTNHAFHFVDGIVRIYESENDRENEKVLFQPPVTVLSQYYKDINRVIAICSNGPSKTHAFARLRILEAKFNLHKILNADREKTEQKNAPHRDFYNICKVDTHIHLSAAMNQKHLLKFIKRKVKEDGDSVVIFRDEKLLTLKQVFESLQIVPHELSVDKLDVHADNKTFHRFDKFNLKYNPVGESRLREIFLKTNNHIKGRYFAEVTKELIGHLESSKYQCAEWRVSIYGRSRNEWRELAEWVIDNDLISNNVRYLVQIPRLYDVYHANKQLDNFQQLLDNVFIPLFEVTIDPTIDPKLAMFLNYCIGMDCVDDESKPEPRLARKFPAPHDWNFKTNPPYTYYLFYLWSNLYSLNMLRKAKKLPLMTFRPHSGEAGDVDHLIGSFFLANGIAHGINLRRAPVLQYLYYLMQVPIAVSPLSNNSLFIEYSKNPFPIFFARGLNLSLSTDDPLQFHYTKEPLIEEYAIAAQVWKLTSCDICEIARMSVLQSGFPEELKAKWLGPDHLIKGNDMNFTNVPTIRINYRKETLKTEFEEIFRLQQEGKNLETLIAIMTSHNIKTPKATPSKAK